MTDYHEEIGLLLYNRREKYAWNIEGSLHYSWCFRDFHGIAQSWSDWGLVTGEYISLRSEDLGNSIERGK